IFNCFLDKPDPLVAEIAVRYDAPLAKLLPVRVVSHHMRLLGVFIENGAGGRVVLVDFDDTKDG
ncbi:MAG: hypothetical protein MIO92_00445, partial [Methanosarcinaceae archaeon]|nr:hypothetical protein [Methanosarcinaceae archaeon]